MGKGSMIKKNVLQEKSLCTEGRYKRYYSGAAEW